MLSIHLWNSQKYKISKLFKKNIKCGIYCLSLYKWTAHGCSTDLVKWMHYSLSITSQSPSYSLHQPLLTFCFQEFDYIRLVVEGNHRSLSVCSWLLSTMSLKFIHVVYSICQNCLPFRNGIVFCCMFKPHLLACSSVDRHLRCTHLPATVIMHPWTHTFLWSQFQLFIFVADASLTF